MTLPLYVHLAPIRPQAAAEPFCFLKSCTDRSWWSSIWLARCRRLDTLMFLQEVAQRPILGCALHPSWVVLPNWRQTAYCKTHLRGELPEVTDSSKLQPTSFNCLETGIGKASSDAANRDAQAITFSVQCPAVQRRLVPPLARASLP